MFGSGAWTGKWWCNTESGPCCQHTVWSGNTVRFWYGRVGVWVCVCVRVHVCACRQEQKEQLMDMTEMHFGSGWVNDIILHFHTQVHTQTHAHRSLNQSFISVCPTFTGSWENRRLLHFVYVCVFVLTSVLDYVVSDVSAQEVQRMAVTSTNAGCGNPKKLWGSKMKPGHVIVCLSTHRLLSPSPSPSWGVTSSQRSPVSSVLLTLGASPLPHLSYPHVVLWRTSRPDSLALCLSRSAHCLSDITLWRWLSISQPADNSSSDFIYPGFEIWVSVEKWTSWLKA